MGSLVLLVLWFIPVKKLRRLSTELSEEKQQAEVTLQSIHDGVLRTDKKGSLVYLNPAAEKLIGRSFYELNRKTISEILTLIAIPSPIYHVFLLSDYNHANESLRRKTWTSS